MRLWINNRKTKGTRKTAEAGTGVRRARAGESTALGRGSERRLTHVVKHVIAGTSLTRPPQIVGCADGRWTGGKKGRKYGERRIMRGPMRPVTDVSAGVGRAVQGGGGGATTGVTEVRA